MAMRMMGAKQSRGLDKTERSETGLDGHVMRRHVATGRETGERIQNRRGYEIGGETIEPDRDPTP